VLLVTALTAVTVLAATPAPVAAATAAATPGDMATMFLDAINHDRGAKGLVAYRAWSSLTTLASERAGRMAAAHDLSHATAGGNVGDALDAAGIAWMGYGEIIAASSYPWGPESVANIDGLWTNSPPHASIMFSASYNYVGIGVVQADDGTTWVSAVMTESPDHTAPGARNGALRLRGGNDIVFSWSGSDPRLQTHTAGIASYDVLARKDGGRWIRVRNHTTATSLRLANRLAGHWWTFRVQARDRRGNLSKWTSDIRIRVP